MTEEREEREHITTGLDCWCKPYPLAYGDELIYDEDGNLVEMDQGEAYLWKQRAQVAKDKVKELERLLSRAYPWLHNPYHGTSDYANEAEGDAVIEAVQTAIQHVPDAPDPLLSLPCASCDGTGCENCAPIYPCGADDGSTVCTRDTGHPIPHRAANCRQWI